MQKHAGRFEVRLCVITGGDKEMKMIKLILILEARPQAFQAYNDHPQAGLEQNRDTNHDIGRGAAHLYQLLQHHCVEKAVERREKSFYRMKILLETKVNEEVHRNPSRMTASQAVLQNTSVRKSPKLNTVLLARSPSIYPRLSVRIRQ